MTVDFTALDRQKRAISTIDKKVMNAVSNNGASFLESCFGAPYTFATKPGTPLEVNADYVPGPYPAPEYKGLLPDCGGSAVVDDPDTAGVSGPAITNAGAPCVEKRNKTGSGDGVMTSRWPGGAAIRACRPCRRATARLRGAPALARRRAPGRRPRSRRRWNRRRASVAHDGWRRPGRRVASSASRAQAEPTS